MHNLGRSAYISSFREGLVLPEGNGELAFLSLHIEEEFDVGYRETAERFCRSLISEGYRLVADISKRTLEIFSEPDAIRLSRRLGLHALRIDCGFSTREIAEIAKEIPVFINASTITEEDAALLAKEGKEVYAMHNFYPRPETGLDEDFFEETNRKLKKLGLKVSCFIPGDEHLRGPIHEGLPTLESHRNALPSAAFQDLCERFSVDEIFIGDPGLSGKEDERIRAYIADGILRLPAKLDQGYDWLYGRVFTNRPDSPDGLVRFMESRAYAVPGTRIEPTQAKERRKGTITIDNERYARYSGEIQLMKRDYPGDGRVNVIGEVDERAMLLLGSLERGKKFTLVRI